MLKTDPTDTEKEQRGSEHSSHRVSRDTHTNATQTHTRYSYSESERDQHTAPRQYNKDKTSSYKQPHRNRHTLHLHTPSLFYSLLFWSSFTLFKRTRTEHIKQMHIMFEAQLSGSLSTPEADTWLHITLTSLEEKASQLLHPLSPFIQNRSPIVRSENNSTAKVCSQKKHWREQHTHTDTLKLISSSSSAVSSILFQQGISSHLPLILFLDVICMLLPSVEENMCLLSRDLHSFHSTSFVCIHRVPAETSQKYKQKHTHCTAELLSLTHSCTHTDRIELHCSIAPTTTPTECSEISFFLALQANSLHTWLI